MGQSSHRTILFGMLDHTPLLITKLHGVKSRNHNNFMPVTLDQRQTHFLGKPWLSPITNCISFPAKQQRRPTISVVSSTLRLYGRSLWGTQLTPKLLRTSRSISIFHLTIHPIPYIRSYQIYLQLSLQRVGQQRQQNGRELRRL